MNLYSLRPHHHEIIKSLKSVTGIKPDNILYEILELGIMCAISTQQTGTDMNLIRGVISNHERANGLCKLIFEAWENGEQK